jgi:hypothetical protein
VRYQNIETVIQNICSQETAATHPWIPAAFNGISVAMHFARVAHGNEHMANLKKIENAIWHEMDRGTCSARTFYEYRIWFDQQYV